MTTVYQKTRLNTGKDPLRESAEGVFLRGLVLVNDLERGCGAVYVVNGPCDSQKGLLVLGVAHLDVVGAKNTAQDNHTTLALTGTTVSSGPTVQDKCAVGRLCGGVGERRNEVLVSSTCGGCTVVQSEYKV